MSSDDVRRCRMSGVALLRAGATAALLALAGTVTGCADGDGFRPLYAPGPSGIGVEQKLKSVTIAPIPSRVGQRLRNELIFHTTGGGEADTAVYKLEITIRESVLSTLVKSDGTSLSQIYALEASFKLIHVKDRKVILQGQSFGRAAFERYPQIYSNIRAREDAEDRAAVTIADDLRTRLAAFLATHKV